MQFIPQTPAYIIAEAGVNHNGCVETAKKLVLAAKKAGANAVKFQTFRAERVAQPNAAKADYQLRNTDPQESQIEMLRKLELPSEAHHELLALCRGVQLDFISTPYNEEDIDFLHELGVDAIKLASIHLVEPHLLRYAARTGRRIILSTGMSTLEQVGVAVRTLRSAGCEDFTLLQCTTNYPSAIADANLLTMNTMRTAFDCAVGYSDHTQSEVCCIASIALGASMIEKHFTLDKTLPGPDHSSASEPEEFASLVRSIRDAEAALGSGEKLPSTSEQANAANMRRSLVARSRINAGTVIQEDQLTCRRPSTGISPMLIDLVAGRMAGTDIAEGTAISWEMLG
jgi:N-acetylneuraminate synthase/N,N'-diacetyllegionaminate synthase